MDYKCKTILFSKLLVTPFGIMEPLCNNCKNRDCSNNIEKITVSILGVNKNYRLLVRGNETFAVISCDGVIE